MRGQTIHTVSKAIRYIEENLHHKLELDRAAEALHYSKFHLHRIFAKTVGLTIHDYARRRQLTEAARLLIFSKKPILEIALLSGYESQQAFTGIFKAMYKETPARFRETQEFYPLQTEIHLKDEPVRMDLAAEQIQFADFADMDNWMELVRLAIDGYPRLDEADYTEKLKQYIAKKQALLLQDEGQTIGAMAFSADSGNIDFLAVHPQYRNLGIARLFLDKLTQELLCGREITLSTYRAGDKADTGYREEYRCLGFVERDLLVEYGYPVQRFALPLQSEKGEAGK